MSAPMWLIDAESTSHASVCHKLVEAAGGKVRSASGAPEVLRLSQEQSYDALVLHRDTLRALGDASASLASRLILVADQSDEALLTDLARRPLAALIAKQTTVTDEELTLALRNQLGQHLGIDKYLSGGKVFTLELTDSTRRGEAFDEFDRFLGEKGVDARFVGSALTVADELVTNAFYNAPVDEHGRRPYAHASRIDLVRLQPEHAIRFSYGCDGERVVVGVRDQYGSLDWGALLRHLAKAFAAGSSSSTGGLGLMTAYRAASRLVFNIVAKQMTECIGLIEIGGGYRKFVEAGKSFEISNVGRAAAARDSA